MNRICWLAACFLMFLEPYIAIASDDCSAYEAEAEAYSGIVPKFNQDGSVRAILMYGEGTFLANKRSLIADARRKAEMRAKQAYAEFLKSDFDSQSLAADLVETAQKTDQDGNTSGSAVELSSTLNQMRNDSSATLSGIVKLDECVNTQEKYVLVTMGWKPSLTRAAADSSAQMSQVANSTSTSGAEVVSQGNNTVSESRPTTKIAGVEMVTVSTRGVGGSLQSATNEALRAAVSQVFGEQFAAQTSVIDSVTSMSATVGTAGVDAVVEQSSSANAVQSSTSGIIRSWSYIEQYEAQGEHHVTVSVTMPQYKSSIDKSKSTMIVVTPLAGQKVDESDPAYIEFAELLRSKLEGSMNATASVTVLDRSFSHIADQELRRIQNSSNVAEMAKLGNQAGADLMLISTVDEFQHEKDVRKIGDQTIERTVFNVILTTKVIEVATSNLIDTRRFPQMNKKIRSDTPTQEIALFMAERLGRHLATRVGGGSVQFQEPLPQETAPDMRKIRGETERQFEEMRENAKDDW